MEFSPFNPIVKLCLQGMALEDNNLPEEARKLFEQAWNEATNDQEKFLAAHYISQHQSTTADRLKWLETALECALKMNDDAVTSVFPALYTRIAECYEALNEPEKAKAFTETANAYQNNPSDKGPFYHGTKADLQVGDLLTPGGTSNYQSGLTMNHIYFTALVNGAGLAAALASGEETERVYMVEPTGNFENDPNLTDKKFPGNPSRSYRSDAPLKIVGEATEWVRYSEEDIQKFKAKLDDSKGEIIN